MQVTVERKPLKKRDPQPKDTLQVEVERVWGTVEMIFKELDIGYERAWKRWGKGKMMVLLRPPKVVEVKEEKLVQETPDQAQQGSQEEAKQ